MTDKPKESAEDILINYGASSRTKDGVDLYAKTEVVDAMNHFAQSLLSAKLKEQHRNTRHQAAELCAKEGLDTLHSEIMNLKQIEPPIK